VNRAHAEVINLLLDHGADVNAQDRQGWTPLHHAVRGNQIAVVRQLIGRGANLEIRGYLGRTPLLMAAQLGQGEIFEILVRGGADINSKSTAAETASDLAIANQHRKIVDFLNKYQQELKEFSRNSSARY
jgi:hypothetical protein